MVKCLECGDPFGDEKHLHKHLRKHGFDMAIYYHKFFPRYDKLTGDLIRFVHKEQYFADEFNSPDNFRAWLTSQPLDIARDYCRGLLYERKEKKSLVYSPSQVELRSLGGPSMIFLTKIFPNYYEVCAELGYKNKYKLTTQIPNKDIPYFVQIDTREQRLLAFEGATVEKLNYGDYKLHDNKNYAVYFERKSLGDFVGTLSVGYERFTREIERAVADNNHLIIVVESPLIDALNFNKLEKKSFTTKTTPQYIFHNVRALIQKFENAQFLFVHGRHTAMKVMKRIYQMGDSYKEVDLQWCYDTNLFNT
jgi:hypothetical protein